ncbi:MAG TPA: pyrroline-5-carboxylate reductase, partial [Rhodocyclaceae bacterium]|nr:pyrroline-5-carboxylate reductase [Rhodocyclaceae bacterium]
GNMAAALIGGLREKGYSAAGIQVIELNAEARERLTDQFGVRCTDQVDAAALNCETLVLAVKPQQMREAVAPFVGKLGAQLVISIAAGLRVTDIARWLGNYPCIVRTMPNTPALIGAGITGLYAAPEVDAEQRELADKILGAVGSTIWVDQEAQVDDVTAISGSGPAYVFYFIEALEAAALELGFDVIAARKLAIETTLGAARLAAHSNEAPGVLRERVTSKGGTTEAALRSLDHDTVRAAIGRAAQAAAARGRELGIQLGQD